MEKSGMLQTTTLKRNLVLEIGERLQGLMVQMELGCYHP
jgi:hypothetical protein